MFTFTFDSGATVTGNPETRNVIMPDGSARTLTGLFVGEGALLDSYASRPAIDAAGELCNVFFLALPATSWSEPHVSAYMER